MSSCTQITALVASALAASPVGALAADKQSTDMKQFAGTWQGWVN